MQNQIFSFSYSENVILNDLSFQSIEDFILLVGTSVAFIAFILWCCFPIEPKDSLGGSEHLTTQVIKGVLSEYWLKSVHFFSTNETLRCVCFKVNMSLSFIGLKNPWPFTDINKLIIFEIVWLKDTWSSLRILIKICSFLLNQCDI